MGKNGGCDYKDWEDLYDKLVDTEAQVQLFIEACAKELAARLLARAIKRTPVGQYPAGSGKTGGTLRRGWTAGKSAAEYVNSLAITRAGNTYTIEIVNPIEYASYVEFGHRTRDHSGWVKGRFMLTVSEQEIESAAPLILEKKIQAMLGECFK
ncbi:MAG: HK97 gp10 family phage protein [Oscillospiraceae bacterium]